MTEKSKQVSIPVLDEHLEVIGATVFEDNLTLHNVPDYVNMNGHLGLKRLSCDGIYDREILLMYYDPQNPECSYAEFISELDAYKLCLSKNKKELANKLGLTEFMGVEREVL